MRSFFGALVAILSFSTSFALNVDYVCDAVPIPQNQLAYCVADAAQKGKSSVTQVDVIYFFHGLGGNERDLFTDRGRQVLDLVKLAYGNKTPIIVSLSIGAEGVFASQTADILQGMKDVEARIAPAKTIRRVLLGGSMGGHNSLRLAAESPNAFRAIAALCPAVGTFNGYNDGEVEAYIQRNKGMTFNEKFLREALVKYKKTIRTAEEWDANNPFTFLERGTYDRLPIFVSVGREDSLGFVEGSREFKRRGDSRPGMRVDYHEYRGPHCTFDPGALVRFLSAQF